MSLWTRTRHVKYISCRSFHNLLLMCVNCTTKKKTHAEVPIYWNCRKMSVWYWLYRAVIIFILFYDKYTKKKYRVLELDLLFWLRVSFFGLSISDIIANTRRNRLSNLSVKFMSDLLITGYRQMLEMGHYFMVDQP